MTSTVAVFHAYLVVLTVRHGNVLVFQKQYFWIHRADQLLNPPGTATSNENTIAPPESIRFYIQDHHTFVRAGPLFLHWTEPHHEDFLTHTPTIKLLIQWLQKQ